MNMMQLFTLLYQKKISIIFWDTVCKKYACSVFHSLIRKENEKKKIYNFMKVRTRPEAKIRC